MIEKSPATKDLSRQTAIPAEWRETLKAIVDAFVEQDYRLARGISGTAQLNDELAHLIAANIADYGMHLIYLPAQSWNTSACQWMGTYWDLFVDLFTEEEGASDLALSVRVREGPDGYVFQVKSVYVP